MSGKRNRRFQLKSPKIHVRSLLKSLDSIELHAIITNIRKPVTKKPLNIAYAVPHEIYVEPLEDGTCPLCGVIHSP